MKKEKTIAAVRLVRLSLVAASLFLTTTVLANATPVYYQDFHTVTFSGDCSVQNGSETKQGRLHLMMSPKDARACVATLVLRSPLPFRSVRGFRFGAEGTRPRQYMAFEFAPRKDDMASVLRSPRFAVTNDWKDDAMRFSRLEGEDKVDQIAAIRIIVFPILGAAAQPVFTVAGFRFVGVDPVNPEEADPTIPQPSAEHKPDSLPLTSLASPTPAPPVQIASPPSPPERFHHRGWVDLVHRHSVALGLLCLWGAGALILLKKRKAVATVPMTPLFEMNTRTWKSRKDNDGVLHVGGFRQVTTVDLKTIKSSGFNSLWLMGVWEIGAKVRHISRRYGTDFAGSPFAISDYAMSMELGAESDFTELVTRAHDAGLSVILDFVPNHMGLDSVWLNDHPEYFIHHPLDPAERGLSETELEERHPGYFVYHTPSYPENGGRVPKTILVAYGKDPFFYPWIDTAQLDYAQPGLRRKMIDILSRWAKIVDGVRCDMAMLVLRGQVKVHRHPEMSWEEFNQVMPEEFWSEAIRCVKRINPQFAFIAETYWSMEGYLQQLGFDYTYNKPLYEAMCHAFHTGNADGLMNFIRMLGTEFLKKGVHFLENHDEERAMNALGDERQRAAAVMLATLPGVALIHQGQLEGKRERLPVQRVVPLHEESDNQGLAEFYRKLLRATSLPIFRVGRMQVLYSNNSSLAAFARVSEHDKAVVIVNTSNEIQKGSVFLSPGIRLKTGTPYRLDDIFYELKPSEVKDQLTVKRNYLIPAAQLINQGLYVELQPYDAHIFLLESPTTRQIHERARHVLREINDFLPLPRAARRIMGPVLTRSADRSSDQN